jgi:site-specific recombinase XerD
MCFHHTSSARLIPVGAQTALIALFLSCYRARSFIIRKLSSHLCPGLFKRLSNNCLSNSYSGGTSNDIFDTNLDELAVRRQFALSMLNNGVDISSLQRLMGHQDIAILRRYLAQTTDDICIAHAKGSPVENYSWG